MKRAIVLALLVAASLLLPVVTGAVSAAGPSDGSTVQLSGQAYVQRDQGQATLVLSADASDGSGWHLDAALQPVLPGTQGDDGGTGAISLAGQFQLVGPNTTTLTGQAAGQLDNQGTGSLTLQDDASGTQLAVAFGADSSGGITLTVSGLPSAADPVAPASGASGAAQAAAATQPVDHTFWYISRAAGMSAYVVLFANMVLGLAVTTKVVDGLLARWRSFDLHQFTGLLALALLVIHAAALLGDHYVGFTLAQLLVPFAATYRPIWIAVGIVGGYAMVIIGLTFYVRRQIGQRAWRAIHYVSYAAYFVVLAHSVLSGTDTSTWWAQLMYWSTGLSVVALTIWRLNRSDSKPGTRAETGSLAGARITRRVEGGSVGTGRR